MAKSNNTLGKILYWCIAILVCSAVGMIFPGIGHAALIGAAWFWYREMFH